VHEKKRKKISAHNNQSLRHTYNRLTTTTNQKKEKKKKKKTKTKQKQKTLDSREPATTREDKIWRKTRELQKKKTRPLLRDCKQSERGQLAGSSGAAEYETVTGRAGKTGM
jgi:hypothetical protein